MEQNWRSLEANLVKVTMPCFQLRAEALHDRDDSNSDPGRDEAILNGSRARLILQEAYNDSFHGVSLRCFDIEEQFCAIFFLSG